MDQKKMDRREFLKMEAAAMAAVAGGMAAPAAAQNLVTDRAVTELKWDKAPCRFCGTGCGVMVAAKDGRVVATHGDIKAEVNRGLNCVKGYFLSKVMYGHDRLTRPLLRKRNGRYDKNGEFTPVSWDEAFDVMAEKFKDALRRRGPSGVGMFGSGQWTIWEGYAANKLFKAGFRSNNLDPNARHCMASAVMGFMRSFGIDEPMGCYDDFEAADAFVLWGSNMAEMHPILWSRVTDRRLSAPHVRVAVLSTFEHRSFDLADVPMVFKPQTDLAILNAIANHIITTGRVNKDFVSKHTVFKRGQTDIGYGLRPDHPLEQKATGRTKAGDATDITFEDYAKFVSEYTLEKASALSGVPVNRLRELAELYADPKTKVVSFWTMGFNQHTRGVWCNNLVYNIHLLTGKISEPGNSPFSLTGQPSACGTAREVGTFSHRLPADMLVANKDHRDKAEKIWKVPEGTIIRNRAITPCCRTACCATGCSMPIGCRSTTISRPPPTSTKKAIPATAIRKTSSSFRKPIRPSPRRPRTWCCRPRCGWRRKAPTAMPSAARSSGTSSSTRPAKRAPTSGSSWSSPSASRSRRSGRPI